MEGEIMEKGTDSIYWEKEVETLPRKDLEALQLKRLRDTFGRVGWLRLVNKTTYCFGLDVTIDGADACS